MMGYARRFGAAAMVAYLGIGSASAAEDASGNDAVAAVLEAAIASLQQHPSQLSITVNATGLKAANKGGTGFNSSPTITGGSGSYTGFKVDGVGSVEVLRGAANDVAVKQSAETVQVLEQIRDALNQEQNEKAQSLLTTLKDKAVDVVYEVVKAAVLARLRLPK